MIKGIVVAMGMAALSVCAHSHAQVQPGGLAFRGAIVAPTCVVRSGEDAGTVARHAQPRVAAVQPGTSARPCSQARTVRQVPAGGRAGNQYIITYH